MAIDGVPSLRAGNTTPYAESFRGGAPAYGAGFFMSLDDWDLTPSVLVSPTRFTMHMTSRMMQFALGKPQAGASLSDGLSSWGGVASPEALMGRFLGTEARQKPEQHVPKPVFFEEAAKGGETAAFGDDNRRGGSIGETGIQGKRGARARQRKGKGFFNLNLKGRHQRGRAESPAGDPLGALSNQISGLLGFGGGLGNSSVGDSAVISLLKDASPGSHCNRVSEPVQKRRGSSESLFDGLGKLISELFGWLSG